ncbi:hypothetical protein [Nannocystis sp.]|uniref:LNS2 domain-containing protein n=1 Tax=Nannocystis sp. TaxID=1962667 RepID=UPI0025D3BD0F|nr:hypothetical protein [Nannocystis sp.]
MRSALVLPLLVLTACGDGSRPTDSDAATTTATATDPGTSDAPPTSTSGELPSTSGDEAGMSTGASAPDSTSDAPTTADPATTTGDDTTGGSGPVPGAFCAPIPKCDATPPTLPGQGAESSGYSRGRDMFYVEGQPQWVLAKFTKWGFPIDKDVVGSTVHIFLDRDCAGAWEELGTTVTTDDGEHAIVEGVEDSGGRVYFQIPADKLLGPGRHRVHMVDEDEWETATAIIDIVPKGAPFFVSDVDGTLTTSENEEAWDFLLDNLPDANPFSAQALGILASKGYRPMYITARPEWLDRRTREFVTMHNFPQGIIHTTTIYEGATGAPAAAYKTGEFAQLKAKGLVPTFVFGNRDSDALAFDNAGVEPPDHRFFFQFTDTMFGGRRIDSYEELLAEFEALPDLCH